MKNLSVVLSLLTILMMSGCSDNSSSGKRVTTRGNRGTPVAPSTPGDTIDAQTVEDVLPQGQRLSGEIFEVSKLSLFQDHTVNLVSSFMEPAYLDLDEDEFGLYGAETGVSFGAEVEFKNIDYEPGMELDSTVTVEADDAKLRISIFDSLVGEEYVDDNGDIQTYTEIPMDFGLDSLVFYRITNGSKMAFLFRDVFGEVYFSSENFGGFTNEGGRVYFIGSFHYRNFTDYRGNDLDGKWNTMGYFKIPACGFFKCR